MGDRDRVVPLDELMTYARSIGARLEVVPGSDHFFVMRDERVAEIVAETVLGDR